MLWRHYTSKLGPSTLLHLFYQGIGNAVPIWVVLKILVETIDFLRFIIVSGVYSFHLPEFVVVLSIGNQGLALMYYSFYEHSLLMDRSSFIF